MEQHTIQNLNYLLSVSEETIRKGISKKIREERLRRNLTIPQLAELLDISASFMGLVERGKRMLYLPKLIKLCVILEIDFNYLLGLKDNHPLKESIEKNLAIHYLLAFDDARIPFVNMLLHDLYLLINTNTQKQQNGAEEYKRYI